MAAQVEVQTGDVGRTVTGGRLHLSPLTDSSNKSLIEIPSINHSLIITPEPNKPVPGPKPRLTPKPFAVERNPTIRPILAPKPQTHPRPESTRLSGHKLELPCSPKPQQPVAISKPRPTTTTSTTSFRASTKFNTGQTTKPVVQPFQPAPPLELVDLSRLFPLERKKPGASSLAYSKSLKNCSAAEWAGTTRQEKEKDQMVSTKVGTSITRAKSTGFLAQMGQEENEKEINKPEAAVPLRPQPRGSRSRPVSAIFLSNPTETEAPVAAPRWAGRRPLSADLTSRFESIGLSLHRKSPKADTKENTPEENALPQRQQQEKNFNSDPSHSTDVVAKPAISEQNSNKKTEEKHMKETDEDKRGVSIKSRISLLLDSSCTPGTGAAGQTSDLLSPVQPVPETEPPVGVKRLIKQLTEDTPTQSPIMKPALKPRPLPLDRTKRFSSERSPDLGSVSLSEATESHEISKDPQKRIEESAINLSDQRTLVDCQEQLKKASITEGPEAGQTIGASSNKSVPVGEVQTVRASLFENVVERHSVLMLEEGKLVNKAMDSLSTPSIMRETSEDEGTLVTATYKEPASPSSPLQVIHAVDTLQAVEESRAVSESIPSAQWEDKAMTLRSRRSEGNRPAAERTGVTQGEKGLAVMSEQKPRYLRVGSLQKWNTTNLDQDYGKEKGMLLQTQREEEVALPEDRDAQRESEQEEVAAAPKRLKMLQPEELSKPRATYFALTGQIHEPDSPVDEGTYVGDKAVPYDDLSMRYAQGSSQGRILPIRRNSSLDEAFGKSPEDQVEDLKTRMHISHREIRPVLNGQTVEEIMEVEKKRELEKEPERYKGDSKELKREKQRQLEMEKQAHLEFARMKEREMQREFERQRQKAFEIEKREFEEKQRALEKQKQLELEKQKLQELEREKQRDLDRERLRQLETEKLREVGRQMEMEREKHRELEKERQRELERQRQQEKERQRHREEERQRELERQRHQEEERQRELERQREEEKQRQREEERQREQEMEWQRQREEERLRELYKEKQRELERQREEEKQRQREEERQREQEKEWQRQREEERLRELYKEKQRELERQREEEKERQRELQRKRDEERQREQEKERQRELQRKREEERQREQEKERRHELERQRRHELDRQRQKEEERQRQQELERQREWEKQRQREEERQRELDKERQLLEIQKEKHRMEELQRIKESETKRKLMAQEQEILRLKELDKERERQAEKHLIEVEREKQRELERKRQMDLERERQKQLDFERRELENQRLRKLEMENERKEELERRQSLNFEKQKQAERDKQHILEIEKGRLRERMEKEGAEKMRQIARQQEAERQRLKEKQRKEEQVRVRLDSSPLRPQVVDLDSVLRRSDRATRWKEPSPRAEESYKPAIVDIDSFTSQTQPSPSKDLFPVSNIQGVDTGFGARSQSTLESDVSWKVPPQISVAFVSQEWTLSPQDPWELQSAELSVDQPNISGFPGGVSSGTLAEQTGFPRELQPQYSRGENPGQRRSQGSQELNRMRSRSVSRRSAPSSSAVEGSLSRMRSRSAHREQDRHSWVQQKQSVSGEEEGRDSETPVHETDSQYGTWETGLRTDDSLTPATPSSESNLSPSPRKPTPSHTLDEYASQFDTDILDGLHPSSSSENQPLSFPDAPTTLLDNSALRSRAQLGKKRAPRTRPSRAARQSATQAEAEGEGGTTEDWLYRDSTEERVEIKKDDSDLEEKARGADASPAVACQPQRIALFPGVDPLALKAQLKKRGDSDNQTDGPSPSLLSRSPKSPFLPRAARVLPPPGGKENGEEDSPQWLKELKSKKRLSQYENEN